MGTEKQSKLYSRYSGWERELLKSFPAIGEGSGTSKKFSHCSGTGFQGAPLGKYTGTGIPAHACQTISQAARQAASNHLIPGQPYSPPASHNISPVIQL